MDPVSHLPSSMWDVGNVVFFFLGVFFSLFPLRETSVGENKSLSLSCMNYIGKYNIIFGIFILHFNSHKI